MTTTRTTNSIRNMAYGFGGQCVTVFFSFICRTVFIQALGATYLGVNSLFSTILSLLSFAELGIGNAILYSMYKPMAEKDEEKISALNVLFASYYRIVGCAIMVLGFLTMPFIDALTLDQPDIIDFHKIYMLFVINSVISYFFAHKSTVLIADQKRYIITLYSSGFNVLQNIIQIILLIMTKNFILYLCVQIGCTFFNNYFISKHTDKTYPFLTKKTGCLDNTIMKTIHKNIGAMSIHKFSEAIFYYTDNILIALFAGVYWVGLYSNYSMIIGIISRFTGVINSSISASIGNFNAQESSDKSRAMFNVCFFVSFWITALCAIGLWILLNPFITLWIGKQYVLSENIVLLIVINYYVLGMRAMVLLFKDSFGLFWNDRYKGFFESAINLLASFMLGKEFGLLGVLLGTSISTMTTCFWIEPYILYKHAFKKSIWNHFASYLKYTSVFIIALLITQCACALLTVDTVSGFIGRLFCCLFIPNLLFLLCFFKMNEFAYMYSKVKECIDKKVSKERSVYNEPYN